MTQTPARYTLLDAACPEVVAPIPAPVPTIHDQLLAAFRSYGCFLTAESLDTAMAGQGLTAEQIADFADTAEALLADGTIVVGPEAENYWLSDGACGDAAPPQDERFRQLIRSFGCSATDRQLTRMMAGAGLDPALRADFVARLQESGQAGQIGAELVLAPHVCDPGLPVPEPRAALIAALIDNGCRIHERNARVLLPAFGVTMEEAEVVGGAMIREGEAMFADGVLTLAPSLCRS